MQHHHDSHEIDADINAAVKFSTDTDLIDAATIHGIATLIPEERVALIGDKRRLLK